MVLIGEEAFGLWFVGWKLRAVESYLPVEPNAPRLNFEFLTPSRTESWSLLMIPLC